MFDHFAADLSRVRKTPPGNTILCPLCVQEYTRADLDTQILTEEHCVPGEAGGRLTILTCKPCNNKDGSALDAHVVNLLKMWNMLEGIEVTPVELTSPSGVVNADLEWSEVDPITIRMIKKASNPHAVEEIRSRMKAGRPPRLGMTLDLQVHPLFCRRGLVRAAYLCLTHFLGYQYVLSDGGAAARELIGTHAIEPPLSIVNVKPQCDFTDPYFPVPLGSMGYHDMMLVILRLTRLKTRYVGVFLPCESDVSLDRLLAAKTDLMRRTVKFASNGKPYEFRFTEDPLILDFERQPV